MPRLFSINLGGGGSGTLVARANIEPVANGAQTVSVVFSSDIGTVNYALNVSMFNDTDADPIYLIPVITQKLSTGFTVEFNATTDSANYVLDYMAAAYV